jgi:hypothetical protein
MSRKQGPMDALSREAFLAALELGVSPLVNSSYGPMRGRELHTMAPGKVSTVEVFTATPKATRKTRKGVVLAADILEERGVL